jgi:predicted homoserine dehydrogenase-like protein
MTIHHQAEGTVTRVAVTGAAGGYARTLVAQLARTPDMTATQLVDPDSGAVRTMLADLGVPAGDDAPRAVAGIEDVDWDAVDVLVEATGRVDVGTAYARAAIAHGVHVVMVSKEIETVAGVTLAAEAAAAGVRYLPGDGDQPANLIRLLAWVERVGLEVVALGKSSEYDLVFDPAAGTVTQLDTTIATPALGDLLTLDAAGSVRATLAARADLVADLKRSAAADHCEMTVVSLYSGALADAPELHYPVVRPDELADVYAAHEDGGITHRTRSVDVFSALRLTGEASFGGGVFVVVRTTDPETWRTLAGKGHVVSRDGRYACIYWPYHLMGVETPLTIAAAVTGDTTTAAPAQHSVLAGRTARALPAGTDLRVAGHHHEIDGIDPVILDGAATPADVAPFYLLGGGRTARDLPAGHVLTATDVDGVDTSLLSDFATGLAAAAGETDATDTTTATGATGATAGTGATR